jgi:hypothetical protein
MITEIRQWQTKQHAVMHYSENPPLSSEEIQALRRNTRNIFVTKKLQTKKYILDMTLKYENQQVHQSKWT